MSNFSGFPAQTLPFLADLATNNTRAWFEAHRADYEAGILAPGVAFVTALGSRLQALSPGITFDTRTNGSGSMMRIYRDVRFSQDKSPYHTYLRFVFWEGPGKKTETPAFFLRIAPEGVEVYAGMYQFPKPILARFREAAADDVTGPALADVIATVGALDGVSIGGEQYKRVPSGYPADHPRADLLRYKALYAVTDPLDAALITTPDAVEVLFAACERLAPVQQWLVKNTL